MARWSFEIAVVSNRFPELVERYPQKASAAVHKTAYDIEARAKAVVPVDTGNLKNSIRSEFSSDGLTGYVGTSVEYAPYVEFGTRKMGARPYLTTAAETARDAFVRAVEEALKGT